MILRQRIATSLLLCLSGYLIHPAVALSQAAPTPTPATLRDGQHDFDFNIATWNTHIRRLVHPLSGSTATVDFDGTVATHKIWNGRAQFEEIEASGPAGHFKGLTLFLYNPLSHQWSQTFASIDDGTLNPSAIGEFKDGRAELFDQETFNDRSIFVRGVWSNFTPDTHTFEQSFSNDGGKTWETNFSGSLTRRTAPLPPPANPTTPEAQPASTLRDGQHDFDFDFGTWKTHTSRLQHPLTGSKTWIEMDGTTVVRKVWDGRANLAELESDGPTGHLELLSLRLYNPAAHQWNLNFATSNVGTLSVPMVGEFKDGHGVFYDQEPYNGRTILVRFTMTPLSPTAARSEQAFSDHGDVVAL
jgi:hypothetical protein